MDTITHAIAGALIGKGFFSTQKHGSEQTAGEYSQPSRVAIFAATIGAAFPDIDVFVDFFSRDDQAMLKYHRYITHSWICLPIWALLLAWLTRIVARRVLKIESPSFGFLWVVYAAAIASHIILDLATSFGTMCWSPLSRVRAAWDIIFIVDLTMTALLLLPQVTPFILRSAERRVRRASRMWALFAVLAVLAYWFARSIGLSLSPIVIVVAIALIGALFFIPAITGIAANLSRSKWARAGLVASTAYLLACAVAHHYAFRRVENVVAAQRLTPVKVAALPMAPSLWGWEGLILTGNAVYETHEDLTQPASKDVHVFNDTVPDNYMEAIRDLPTVQTYLWFARFPVYKLLEQNGEPTVMITDVRFFTGRGGPSPGFTFQVKFDAMGNIVQQGMMRGRR
jgi:membrane-bound metal-dependent hydrolase YbcI (DUF457 family)